MKRLMAAAILTAVLSTMPATALATTYTSPAWNLNGTYTIPFTCTSGCPTGPYPYSVTIATTSDETGAVTGTGYYITGNGYPAVTVTGQVSGWDVTLNLSYTDPSLALYNPFVLTGSINQYGGMSGTASDGQGRTFTWLTTSGSVSLFSPTCSYGTYPGYKMVWSSPVSSYSPTYTMPEVTTTPTVPGLTYLLEASGTYFAGGNGPYDIQADAKYSQDAYQRANSLGWTDSVDGYASYGPSLLDLLVDGQAVDWGTYNSDHRYTLPVAATGSPVTLDLNINDIYPQNNTGGLCAALYQQVYTFSGFFAPISNTEMNTVKAGSAVPLQFSLGGDQGLNIFATGYPLMQPVTCGTTDTVNDTIATVTAGSSSLSYDPTSDQYTYVWKTAKSWSDTCGQLVVKFIDGSTETANFSFK